LTVARAKFLLSRFGPLPEIGKVCHWLTTRVGVATFGTRWKKDERDGKEQVRNLSLFANPLLAFALSVESGRKKVGGFVIIQG
jgi:hypothetical protein